MFAQETGNDADDFVREQHSGFRHPWMKTFPNRFKLSADNSFAAWFDRGDTIWILGGDARDRGCAVNSQLSERLRIGLNPFPAAAVRVGNRQDCGKATAHW